MRNPARSLIATLATLSAAPGDDGATAHFIQGPAHEAPSAANPALPKAADPRSQASPQPQAEAQPAANPGYRLVTLHGFSCGDFCYLELTDAGQREPRTFVCLAQLCGDWNRVDNEGELPAGLRMARAEAQFATVHCQIDDYPFAQRSRTGGARR